MEDKKPLVASVGAWGTAIAGIVIVAQMAGHDISADVAGLDAQIANLVDLGIALAGAVAGLYGRLRATKVISGLFKAK